VAVEVLTAWVERQLHPTSVDSRLSRRIRPEEGRLRPVLRTFTLMAGGSGDQEWLEPPCAEPATRSRGCRPGELLEGFSADLVLARTCRTHRWIERDGARWKPPGVGVEEPGQIVRHAQERAS